MTEPSQDVSPSVSQESQEVSPSMTQCTMKNVSRNISNKLPTMAKQKCEEEELSVATPGQVCSKENPASVSHCGNLKQSEARPIHAPCMLDVPTLTQTPTLRRSENSILTLMIIFRVKINVAI